MRMWLDRGDWIPSCLASVDYLVSGKGCSFFVGLGIRQFARYGRLDFVVWVTVNLCAASCIQSYMLDYRCHYFHIVICANCIKEFLSSQLVTNPHLPANSFMEIGGENPGAKIV